MFENFTERSRNVMSLARQEAQRLNSDFIGTEHILLGLIQGDGGVASKVLKDMRIDMKRVRQEIEKLIIPSTSPAVTLGQIPFSPVVKKVIERAEEISARMGHDLVGTEDLLISLMEMKDGIAYQVCMNVDLRPDQVRDAALKTLGHVSEQTMGPSPHFPTPEEMKEAMTRVSASAERAEHELASLAKDYGVHGTPVSCGDGLLRLTRMDGRWGVYLIEPDETMSLVTGASIPVKLEFLAKYPRMLELYRKDVIALYGRIKEAEANA